MPLPWQFCTNICHFLHVSRKKSILLFKYARINSIIIIIIRLKNDFSKQRELLRKCHQIYSARKFPMENLPSENIKKQCFETIFTEIFFTQKKFHSAEKGALNSQNGFLCREHL